MQRNAVVLMWLIFLLVTLIGSIPLLLILYTFSRADKLPCSSPASYLKDLKAGKTRYPVILFAGDSLTHGNIGIGYVNLLNNIHQESQSDIVNAGINGDLCWNLAQRLDAIIACKPSVIFILIGTNDAMSHLPIKILGIAQKRKSLPQNPDDDWFKENMKILLDRLAAETEARIVLMSIPPIGENVESTANSVVNRFNQYIQEFATQRGLTYLPVNEKMNEYLLEHPSTPKYPIRDSLIQMILAMIRHFVFGKEWDAIAEGAGHTLHIDHIHLNSMGAQIIAELVSSYLTDHTP